MAKGRHRWCPTAIARRIRAGMPGAMVWLLMEHNRYTTLPLRCTSTLLVRSPCRYPYAACSPETGDDTPTWQLKLKILILNNMGQGGRAQERRSPSDRRRHRRYIVYSLWSTPTTSPSAGLHRMCPSSRRWGWTAMVRWSQPAGCFGAPAATLLRPAAPRPETTRQQTKTMED
eukprot:COSAG02_NODE_2210_length_9492_cov_22.862877_2_plen_173_part_00